VSSAADVSPLEAERLSQLAASVMNDCDAVAEFTDVPGQVTRLFLSPATKRLHVWLTKRMTRAGMTVAVDAVGNVIGHYPAEGKANGEAQVLILGSHVDTVINAGRYDGPLGVMLAIAAVESLNGARLPFAIDVIAFSEEEGARFHTPYLGSAAVAGQFERRWLDLVDRHGISLANAITTFGLNLTALPAAAYEPKRVVGYLEAHIEQGPVLEQNGWPVAIVSSLAGQSRMRFRFIGRAGHAGTLPMELRADALAAAAEFISATESLSRRTPNLRATVGTIEVGPNLRNVVPGDVLCSVDVRHPDDAQRRASVESLLQAAHIAARSRDVSFHCEAADEQPSVECDSILRKNLAAAVESAGYPVGEIFSGAGHDLVMMSRLCRSAILFIRHPGMSHHPGESVAVEDVAVALDVVRRTILILAASH
jgi:allantoate deiminase